RIRAGCLPKPYVPVHVHPFEMDRVDGVLLTLKPIAGDFGKDDLTKSILPSEGFPIRNHRRRLRPEVCPNQSSTRLDGIGGDANLVLEPGFLYRDVVIGLLD